jgi:choline dehydrogenase-like flavoprotein
MVIVIGSGPAAIAAAHALVQQGHRVSILDVGTCLESDRQQIVNRMSALEPEEWHKNDFAAIVGQRNATTHTVHSKLSYGSAYSFDTRSAAVDVRFGDTSGFNHSLAQGGLSNVWGSSLLAHRQADIEDWPISLSDLEPHYRAVMDFVPGTGIKDDLDEILPTYSTHNNPLEPSYQGHAFLRDLKTKKQLLRKAGIFFGRSRLAIRATGNETHGACNQCALCLSGCPYGLIYSSAQTLEQLIATGSVRYFQDHLVEKFEQACDEVIVTGRNLANGQSFSYRASRVFLGAGVLPTAKIILNSLQVFDRPIQLLDSQYFIYPILRFSVTDGVEAERMHTSSQVFLELDDPSVSEHLVHLQVYGYSTFLHHELNQTFLRWPLRVPAFRRHFLGRLMIAQGFIHSKQSGSIALTLKKAADGKVFLDARIQKSRLALLTTLRVGWKMLKQTFNLRAIPLIPGLQFPNPGSGYHSGGTFPMRAEPRELETDTMGRFPGIDRVHLVDSSVLPSIPGTSITFSMMANSHRIATLAGQLDPP